MPPLKPDQKGPGDSDAKGDEFIVSPRDSESPSHQRPPFADPLPAGQDPTSPGAPHEPGGMLSQQSHWEDPSTHRADEPDNADTMKSRLDKYPR